MNNEKKGRGWLMESLTQWKYSIEGKCQIEDGFIIAIIESFILLVKCSNSFPEGVKPVKKLIQIKRSQIKWKNTSTI